MVFFNCNPRLVTIDSVWTPQGCLPLVLMFDVKDDVEVEATKLAQLMEQLDVFISIKPKPRQPSKVGVAAERSGASDFSGARVVRMWV